MRCLLALTICLLFSGCIVLQPRAENPFPNMNSIAVVPFFNQSAMPGEINDLGRTFGQAYAAELQKTPGYDVLPLGVTETAIIEHRLEFRNEEDVLKLARILDVDAVVVGTITAYDPYYPPKIGMKVNWYSTKNWTIQPEGEPCGPCEDDELNEDGECPCSYDLPELRTKQNNSLIRGQSPVALFEYEAEPLFGHGSCPPSHKSLAAVTANRAMSAAPAPASTAYATANSRLVATPRFDVPLRELLAAERPHDAIPVQLLQPISDLRTERDADVVISSVEPIAADEQKTHEADPVRATIVQAQVDLSAAPQYPRLAAPRQTPPLPRPPARPPQGEPVALEPVPMPPELLPPPGTFVEVERDHTKPVMSYTRFFDGKDEDVVALLRDYVELTGDKRSGGWEGYMQRTDDYIIFCCHQMIVDMLSLHGGALKTKVWLKIRKDP